jgi:uncharacterized protein YuzE
MDLIINYDPEADVLVLKLREGLVVDEELLDNDVVLGYDGGEQSGGLDVNQVRLYETQTLKVIR